MTKQTSVIGAGTSTGTAVGSVGDLMMIIQSFEIGKIESRYRNCYLSHRNEFLFTWDGWQVQLVSVVCRLVSPCPLGRLLHR